MDFPYDSALFGNIMIPVLIRHFPNLSRNSEYGRRQKTYNSIGPFSRFSVDGYHCKKTQQYSLVNLEHISHPCARYPEMSKKMGSFQLDIKARFVRTGGFLDWIGDLQT